MVAIAGHETSANLIGSAVLALLDHPAVLDRARCEQEALGRLVDECLRYDGPVPYTVRVARDDARVGDVAVPPERAGRRGDGRCEPRSRCLRGARPARPRPAGVAAPRRLRQRGPRPPPPG
jgi:hypothetical protein